ncbi:MAG TPA: protein-glutamate O-methyltransferase CheR [Chryseosolibacter sp.]|nr:protein-glutamate O-methyltransferase CheR [Chryseosolibacter sp.]
MAEFEQKEFRELLESIRHVYGYDFTNYAEASVKRRVLHFMQAQHVESLDGLAKILVRDERMFELFIQELSVTVTEMFRDPLFFKCLRSKVIKRLATYPVIRIWVAGCATGEEVYSLAIILKEENLLERVIIYATDINQKSLEIARQGIYPLASMKTYTTNYIKAGGKRSFSEYYQAKYGSVLIDKTLRQNIVFAPHNLTTDNSFNEFQMITCRNVLIYFNQQLQDQVISLFYDSLCTFGFLGLGNKESLLFSEKKDFFEEVDRREKVFMKIP